MNNILGNWFGKYFGENGLMNKIEEHILMNIFVGNMLFV